MDVLHLDRGSAGLQRCAPAEGVEYTWPMSTRIVASLLAFLMLWASLAVTEQRFTEALESPRQVASLSSDPKRGDLNGSMDDHVVDDQPAQSFGEQPLDSGALVDSVGQRFTVRVSGPGRLAQLSHSKLTAPCLQGPQRPPRSA